MADMIYGTRYNIKITIIVWDLLILTLDSLISKAYQRSVILTFSLSLRFVCGCARFTIFKSL